MAFAYVSGTITKGRNPLCGPSSPTEKNKYPRRAAGSCRVQLVKRIVFRDVPGYWLSRGRYIFGRAQIVLLYGRPIARGGSIPAYLTYKGINIEWQVHSGQSRHTWFGHGLFSTHAKLAPLGPHPVLSLSLSRSWISCVRPPSWFPVSRFSRTRIPVARLRIYSKAQPDTIKSVP